MPAWLQRDWCSSFVLALGHFLWQGTLIALVLAIALRATKTVAVRYWLSLAALLLMAVSPAVTLGWLLRPMNHVVALDAQPIVREEPAPTSSIAPATSIEEPSDVGQVSNLPVNPPTTPLNFHTATTIPLPVSADDRSWWQKFAPHLTTTYLCGVMLMLLRLVFGLWGGRRLRRRVHLIDDPSLLAAMRRQATALGLKLLPVLAYCERVTVPTVVGVLKPMILLPLTLTSGLSPEQMESVLAHELAHLRRYDHLVNLLQRVIESLLFFHPALWWVSHRIRDEREHCCDDLVVACGAMPLDYAKSLLVVAELSRASARRGSPDPAAGGGSRAGRGSPDPALGSVGAVSLLATGSQKPSHLRQRIARLLGESATPSLRVSPRALLLAIGIPLVALIVTIQSGAGRDRVARPESSKGVAEDSPVADDAHALRKASERATQSGSPDPALAPTAGLPNSDEETNPPNNANGDLRSNPAAGSGDPRPAQDVFTSDEKPKEYGPKDWAGWFVNQVQYRKQKDGSFPAVGFKHLRKRVSDDLSGEPNAPGAADARAWLEATADDKNWAEVDFKSMVEQIGKWRLSVIQRALSYEENASKCFPKPGRPAKVDELRGFSFGPAAENGIRVAWVFDPAKKEYAVGETLKCRVIVHNSGSQPVQFLGLDFQDGDWSIRDATGNSVQTKRLPHSSVWLYRKHLPYQRYRLEPGHVVELHGQGVGIGEGDHSAAKTHIVIWRIIHARAGDTVRISVETELGLIGGSGKSPFDEVHRDSFYSRDEFPEEKARDWSGALRSGEVKFNVVAAADRAGRGSPDPALAPTAGLPNSDEETIPTNNTNGDLRSNPAAGSGDPRRAQQEPPKPKAGEKLDAGAERRLKWGEPVNGLRAAMCIQSLTDAAGDQKPDVFMAIQNVSEVPIHLVASAEFPNPRHGLLSGRGLPQGREIINPPMPMDVLLQPRQVTFMLWIERAAPDANRGDGRSLAQILIWNTVETLTGTMAIDKAPAGAWTGKLVTGDTSGADAMVSLQPKGKEAQSLFKKWQNGSRANGNIPGGALGPLVRVMTNFIKNNPTHEAAPKFAELLKRFDTARDWTLAEAVTLLDEVSAIYPSLPEWVEGENRFRLGGDVVAGKPLPEELKNAPWGEAQPNGLRVAWLLEPRALKYRLNTPLKSRLLFHNSGKNAVVFRALTWNQSGGHKARDAQGAEISIMSVEWTTIPMVFACRLAPGEFLEVIAAGIGVGANKDDEDWRDARSQVRVGAWIEAKAGDEVTFLPDAVHCDARDAGQPEGEEVATPKNWWLKFIANRLSLDAPLPADAAERKRLLDRATRDLFGNAPTPEEITAFTADAAPDALNALAKRLASRPGYEPFSGSLKSGTRKFLVLPVDPEAAKKPRSAKGPGQYPLGGNVTFVVTRRPIGERIVNEAHLSFSPTDATKPAPREPHPVPLPDGYDSWIAAWMRGGTVLWVAQKGADKKDSIRRYDFTNPPSVKETVITELKPSEALPQAILDVLRTSLVFNSNGVGANNDNAADSKPADGVGVKRGPPDGLDFLKPYPKLHGLSLDMTEPQFLEIVKQQELKTRKTVDGEKVTHHIALGDGHTLIVMFDKDAKCSGIQRVRGEDGAGRGSPDPALAPTAGLPNSEKESTQPNNADGDLRSKPAAGSGDPRRAQEVFLPLESELVDAGTGKPIAEAKVNNRSIRFIKTKSDDVPETVIELPYSAPHMPSRITLFVPQEIMRRADRDELLLEWRGGNDPVFENYEPPERITLKQLLSDDPKSGRDSFRTIKLTPKKQAGLRVLRKPALLLPDHWIVQAVGFDHEGKELVTASNQSFITIRRWDVVNKKLISEIKLQADKHGRAVRDGTLMFSGDRRRVVAATDEYVGIWDATTGKLLKQLPFQTKEGIYSCAIDMLDATPDFSVIVGHRALPGRLTLSFDAHLIVWDGLSGNVLQTVIDKGATDLKALDLSTDGKRLVTTNGGGAKIWETSTGQLLRSILNDNTGRKHSEPDVSSQYTSHVWSVQLSPDGQQLAMGDILGVKLLDATSGKLLQQLEGPYRYSSSGSPGLVFSKDGQWLARLGTQEKVVVDGDKHRYVVPIWSTRTGARLFELHTEANDAAFSDDGQRLAVVFSDMQQALSVWPLSGDAANVEQTAGPGPHSRQDRVEENGHYVGKTAAEFIDKFQPTWGDTKLGLQYGIALTKPQQRKFRSGERVPLVAFFRNASDKPIKFDTAPDFFGNTPKVLNAKDEPIALENIPLLGHIPHYHEQLAPGEALGPFYLSVGLGENPRPGQQHWYPYFKTPIAGQYKLTHSVSINVTSSKESDRSKRDDITNSPIEFEIIDTPNGGAKGD